MDFVATAKLALKHALSDHDIVLTDEMYARYKKVNTKVWTDFELKKISAMELRPLRFQLFFEQEGFFPAEPMAFNARYIDCIVEHTFLYEGVVELLKDLRARYPLGLITNGLKEAQRPRLEMAGITDYFDPIVVSDEIGVAKPDPAFFSYAHERLQHDIPKESVLVVGDNLHADVQGAIEFGYQGCWISHGRRPSSDIVPDLSLANVLELRKHLLG